MKKILLFALLLVCLQTDLTAKNFINTETNAAIISQEINKAQIQQMVRKIIPEFLIEDVVPLPGIFQVIANSEVFYASSDGHYLIHGDLLDLTKNKATINQTAEIRKKIWLKALSDININEMIVFSPPVAAMKNFITVFTDVDCLFCQRFQQEINKITDLGVEVRYLAFPRQGLGSDSYNKAVSIWCSDDPKSMMTISVHGAIPPSKSCDAPIAKHYALGRKLHIQGTPTIIFADGTMSAGYKSPDELAKSALEHKPEFPK